MHVFILDRPGRREYIACMKDFTEYFHALPWGGKTELAVILGIKYCHLDQLARHTRYPSLDLAIRIERHADIRASSWGSREEWLLPRISLDK